MRKTYGVALIGCGHMGEAHLSQIYYKENVRLEYVCDLDEPKALSFQKRYRANHFCMDSRDCISSAQVDIVIIATYPSTHLELVQQCILHQKHVICEKPIAPNPEEGRRFVQLVREHPECKVLVGHILRHNATYQKVAGMIRSGAIGRPIVFRMVQNHHTMDWGKYLAILKETSPLLDC